MNRIYRLVWSRVRNAWLVAAETSRGQGKGAGRKLTRAARALKAAAAGLVGQAFVAASGILLAVNSSAVIAQSIRADGRTQTVVTTSGPITNITTGTVSGVNAFNSFAVFNVGQGARLGVQGVSEPSTHAPAFLLAEPSPHSLFLPPSKKRRHSGDRHSREPANP